MNKHYNLRPYKCDICGNSYTWQSGFKKHVQSHNKELKNFKCTTCKMKFQTQRERRRHELTHKNIAGPSSSEKKTVEPEWSTSQLQPAHHQQHDMHQSQPQQSLESYIPQNHALYGQDMENNYHSYQNGAVYEFDPNSYQPNHYQPHPQMDYGHHPPFQHDVSASWPIHNFDSAPAYATDPHLGWNDNSLSQDPSSSASTPSQGDVGPSPSTDIDMEVDGDDDGGIFREPEDLRYIILYCTFYIPMSSAIK